MNDIAEKVMYCIKEVAVTADIQTDDALVDLGIDSLSIVEILVILEDKFGVEFDDSQLNPDELTTVKNVIDLVGRHLNRKETI